MYTFKDGTEYVMDASWSPIHPALFASVDGQGKLSLWNLNSDTEVRDAFTDLCTTIGHVNIRIVFFLIGNSQWCLYNTQSILIGCSALSQEYCELIGLYWILMRRQLSINLPYWNYNEISQCKIWENCCPYIKLLKNVRNCCGVYICAIFFYAFAVLIAVCKGLCCIRVSLILIPKYIAWKVKDVPNESGIIHSQRKNAGYTWIIIKKV